MRRIFLGGGEPISNAPFSRIRSAHHMARTVGAFQKVGCDVMPYPVDYRTTGTQTLPGRPDVARRMQEFDLAVHSWLGLLAYYLMDRSSDLLPHATATVCASDARGLWGTFREFAKMEAAAVTRDDDEPGQRRWRILRPPPYSRKSIRMSG